MTIEEAIEKAREHGYPMGEGWDWRRATLKPSFWQSLGKALRWGENDTANPYEWLARWHDFIDHLADGKDAESFFEGLN